MFLPISAKFCRKSRPSSMLGLLVACLGGLLSLTNSSPLPAGQVRLNNGMVIRGTPVDVPGLSLGTARTNNTGPVPQTPIYLIDDGMRRYFVPRRQIPRNDPGAVVVEEELSRLVTYRLSPLISSQATTPASVGEFAEVGPFDVHGRRYVTLRTPRGIEPVYQSMVLIRPDYVRIRSTSHKWEYSVSTSTIPAETLRSVIGGTIDERDPDERMAIVYFYIQAEMYPEARRELDSILNEFPTSATRADEALQLLNELNAERGLNEIRRRRQAGQHQLAYFVANQYPADGVPPDLYRQAREIVTEYDQALETRERTLMLLDRLQAAVPAEFASRLPPMLAAVKEELHFETIGRLAPFLRVAQDETLPPEDRLALAYSGWLLGASEAITDLPEAIRLWDARFLVLEYLRHDDNPVRRSAILQELAVLEDVDHARILAMIPQLPLAIESPPLPSGVPFEVEVTSIRGESLARYHAVLPPEYSPHHQYPLLIVLRSEGRTPEQMATFWAGTADQPGLAQRFGYIVISPEYADPNEGSYSYGIAAHQAVLESLQDARKRFRVDSNRVFLTGHGMGATACFDLGMSHPDLFAGVIPINGFCEKLCRPYWENAPLMSWYVVNGERYLASLQRNADIMNEMMRRGHDVIYCEYKDRGFESYAEELPRIFDWMSRLRRDPWQKEFTVRIVRSFDNRFYWMQAGGFAPDRFPVIDWESARPRITSLEIRARITPGNSVHVDHPGSHTTIWLAPQLIDFETPVRIHANRSQIFSGRLQPSLEVILEDLRLRGDREMLFQARVTGP